ncbi:MAG: hypothetical protein INR71_15520, partial [Terriglobus roseus]|nr:hypothetical protein [Terriglobus roseus]
HQWCRANPLWQARPLPPAQMQAMRTHAHTLVQPQGFTGEVAPVRTEGAVGRWRARSRPGTRDSCLQTSLPLYSALEDSPLQTERSKAIYFEVTLIGAGQAARFGRRAPSSLEEADAGVALGFFAPPYPGWRLPGWQRGSLGVHGDDGRRYINDPFGGLDFTEPFRFGETLGIGMVWKPQTSDAPPTYNEASGRTQSSPLAVEVVFTRDGCKAGSWNLHEELDAERSEGGTKGLDGECDVFAAVGVFGQVEVEVCFSPRQWKYAPPADRGGW